MLARLFNLLGIHLHKWEVTYSLSFRVVRRCPCGKVQSLVVEHDRNKRLWVDGNLYQVDKWDGVDLFILTGTTQEFIEAIETITETNPMLRDAVIFPLINWNSENTPEILAKNPYAPILLYGTWYENEAIASPKFTIEINKRTTGE